jgi:predicted dehydrogenase
MIAASREADRRLGVAFYRPFYPKIQRAKELIAAGAIGRPTWIWVAVHNCFNEQNLQDRHWFLEPQKSGGGPLMDVGCHRIDVLNFMFGRPRVLSSALSGQVNHLTVEDAATVILEYPGPIRVVLDCRWNSHVIRDEFRIIGTDGEMDLTPLNGPELRLADRLEHLPPHENLHYPMITNFVGAVLDGIELVSSAERALVTDRALAAAYGR